MPHSQETKTKNGKPQSSKSYANSRINFHTPITHIVTCTKALRTGKETRHCGTTTPDVTTTMLDILWWEFEFHTIKDSCDFDSPPHCQHFPPVLGRTRAPHQDNPPKTSINNHPTLLPTNSSPLESSEKEKRQQQHQSAGVWLFRVPQRQGFDEERRVQV